MWKDSYAPSFVCPMELVSAFKSNLTPLFRQVTEIQFLELHYLWIFISNLELYFSWDGGSISKGFLIN